MHSRLRRPLVALFTSAALVLTPGLAHVDTAHDDVGASGPTTVTLSGGTASTTIKYYLNAANGCDASPSNPVVLGVAIAGDAGVTPSPATVTFIGCGSGGDTANRVSVLYTATTPGTRVVTLTRQTNAGDVNPNPAAFELVVNGAANAAPTVSVTGVVDGTAYQHGSVPTAGCQVVDAEDGSSTPAPVITGTLDASGLGTQTATCTYEDAGGLSGSASATYSVVDTGAPTLTVPGDQTVEATSAAGATYEWTATATDAVDASPSVDCDPDSPQTFPLGATEVTCTATDASGNTDTESFTVTVVDTTEPTLTMGDDLTVEATGPGGATVSYDLPTAEDSVDGPLTPVCDPPSGSVFPLGPNTVSCAVSDNAGNEATGGFTITVEDTTAPTLTLPADLTVEMTSPDGAAPEFTATASDLVSGSTDVTCSPTSGSTFGYGDTTVSCSSTDAAGNTAHGSFTVTVEDTTPPEIAAHDDVTAEATGPSGAMVTYTEPTASDVASASVTVDCIPESGSTFSLGDTTVSCTATDAHGLTAESSFDVHVVDTTAPTLALPGNLTATATSASGATVAYTATASDLVDGSVTPTCSPASGSTFAPGTTTVTCTATDAAGNTASGTFTVTVSFTFTGFFAPVDNNGVLNTIKGGQSVPLKWSMPDGSGGFISSLGVVSSVGQQRIACDPNATADEVEAPTSGQTVLRYDTTANQFIYNWQSPKGAGQCYRVTVNLTDGTSRSALFRTK